MTTHCSRAAERGRSAALARSARRARADRRQRVGDGQPSRRRADHAFDQVVHLLELEVGLAAVAPAAITSLPLLSLSGPLKMTKSPAINLALTSSAFFFAGVRHRRAVGRDLDEALLQPAAKKFGMVLPLRLHLHEARVERLPVPFGAGQVALRRERRWLGVVAADHDAALLGGLDDHLRAVDVQVRTSTPWSIRLLVASASLTGIDQSPVKMTWW